jgi:hypothetical protein
VKAEAMIAAVHGQASVAFDSEPWVFAVGFAVLVPVYFFLAGVTLGVLRRLDLDLDSDGVQGIAAGWPVALPLLFVILIAVLMWRATSWVASVIGGER